MELILDFILIGIIGGLFGIFYRNCLKSNGMLLNSVYYKFLKPIAELPEEAEELGFKPSKTDKMLSFLMYSLGYCIYCSTFWITLILCIIYLSSWEVLPYWQDIVIGIVAAEGIQHFILMCVCRIILYKHPDL